MVRRRRFGQVSTSESDDEDRPRTGRSSRRKKVLRDDDDDDKDYDGRREEEEIEVKDGVRSKRRGGGEEKEADKGKEVEEEEEAQALPIGEPVRFSGKGRKRKKHYASFEHEGNVFELEDPVLLTPATEDEKPYVAIIKDIADSGNGLMVTGQWFYSPEEAAKKGGGTWQARDTRELFYSFHMDDVPAESVMHRCVVHFVPLNKKLPLRSHHPGFIVQKVYDTVGKKLWKLTDKDYEDCNQDEINQLVKKTMDRLGELPDLDPEDIPADRTEQPTSKWNFRRKNMPPIDTSRADGPCTKSDLATPASCPSDASEFFVILAKFKALTGDTYRDKWLEKLLQGIQLACNLKEDATKDNGEKGGGAVSNHTNKKSAEEKKTEAVENFCWPDAAVESITALEKVSHETLGSDFQKYNQKMGQLVFNLKNNALLARRLLNKELKPVVILNMSPNELKDGLTADEKATKEPEESERMQMTDARCTICMEKRTAVTDIIHAEGRGNRYQMDKKQNKGGRGMNRRTGQGTTLREESIGKKRVDTSSMLRMGHLQKLAMWACVEGGIPPLGALFGYRLASSAEAEGIPLDPSIFVCHKCESILKPGSNCTVRIKRNVKKAKQRNKSYVPSQNNVVYKCHFCSHHNILRGTQRGYVKMLLPSKPRPETSSKAEFSLDTAMKPEDEKKLDLKNVGGKVPLDVGPLKLDAFTLEVSVEKSPLSVLERLANSSKKNRKSSDFSANKVALDTGSSSITLNSGGGSNKRKRRGWSSLKQIAENNEAQSIQSLSSFAIPFLLQAGK